MGAFMKKHFATAAIAAASLFFTSSAANAASTLTFGANPSDATALIDATGGAFNFTLNFDGFGGAPAVVPGLTSKIDFGFTGTSNAGLTYNFTYNVMNNSSAPITASRVSLFGFDTNPNISGAAASGTFNFVGNGNVPNVGILEVCFKTQNNGNCAGGGGGGVTIGNSGSGTLALTFGSVQNSIALSNFAVRYQSISGAGQVTSAVGRPITPGAVPEPETWAMMILGMGLVGGAMRRRKPAIVMA